MKKYFLFFSLFLMLVWSWIPSVSAQQKYRYIKREHGVHFQGNIPMSFSNGFNLAAMLSGAYTYNWKGMVEAGPYFKVNSNLVPWALNEWSGGILGEYNIIKNRGKRKLIPAVGFKVGMLNAGAGNQLQMGPYGALKIFVGKRTPFTVSLGYVLLTPLQSPFTGGVFHTAELAMGFSYYFDMY